MSAYNLLLVILGFILARIQEQISATVVVGGGGDIHTFKYMRLILICVMIE
jgi:hypothetical protein